MTTCHSHVASRIHGEYSFCKCGLQPREVSLPFHEGLETHDEPSNDQVYIGIETLPSTSPVSWRHTED